MLVALKTKDVAYTKIEIAIMPRQLGLQTHKMTAGSGPEFRAVSFYFGHG